MKITVDILKINSPGYHNYIYPGEVAEEIVKTINSKNIFGSIRKENNPIFEGVDLKLISHVTKSAKIVEDKIVVEIEILDTPQGNILKEEIKNMNFRPVGYGELDEKGKVSRYALCSIEAIILKKEKK